MFQLIFRDTCIDKGQEAIILFDASNLIRLFILIQLFQFKWFFVVIKFVCESASLHGEAETDSQGRTQKVIRGTKAKTKAHCGQHLAE